MYKLLSSGGDNPVFINIKLQHTTIFLGPNGSGKTRLAVKIEQDYPHISHRISAHRSIKLTPDVPKITELQARTGLKRGNYQLPFTREQQRWHNEPHTHLLDDFDFLVQVLFAEQANTALTTHTNARSGSNSPAVQTKFEKLVEIWNILIPHRSIVVTGDTISVVVNGEADGYTAAAMSDGERSIFYLIGQTLVAEEGALLIFDEPELHIHRAIMSRLWDEIEFARPDCTFVLVTHDLEFAASRVGDKYVIRSYNNDPKWVIESVPEDTGFSEEITTLIVGSRRPILFVEGADNSLDRMIYRACYPDFTVVPRDSCEQVIHAVVTMRANQSLTRVTCFGIVDADDHDKDHLSRIGVASLPVSEIENLFLLPDVVRAILSSEGYSEHEIKERFIALQDEIFSRVTEDECIARAVARHCRRRIDRTIKMFDFKSCSRAEEIQAEYDKKVSEVNVIDIGRDFEKNIRKNICENDLASLLKIYDDKGLLSIAAKHLKATTQKEFIAWVSRMLSGNHLPTLTAAIRQAIPKITAK